MILFSDLKIILLVVCNKVISSNNFVYLKILIFWNDVWRQRKVKSIIWWYQNTCLYYRFLNDLLDADVLIHIIDASGTTNEKGEETVDYDPANDVQWLKEELQ